MRMVYSDAKVLLPSTKLSVPVGVWPLFAATVAVNVTGCPNTELPEEVSAVVVLSRTVSPRSEEMAVSKLSSPA